MRNFQNLVEQVKGVQRASGDAREAWHQLCDQHRGGMRDPTKLDQAFLQQFLATVAAQGPGGSSGGGGGTTTQVGGPSSQDKVQRSALAQRVVGMLQGSKKLQRAWARMCEVDCGGECEPERADVAFIQRFLIKYDDGSWRAASAATGKPWGLASPEQVEKVKSLQRQSAHWREAWQSYCDGSANGMRNPAALSEDFLQVFLDQAEVEDPKALAAALVSAEMHQAKRKHEETDEQQYQGGDDARLGDAASKHARLQGKGVKAGGEAVWYATEGAAPRAVGSSCAGGSSAAAGGGVAWHTGAAWACGWGAGSWWGGTPHPPHGLSCAAGPLWRWPQDPSAWTQDLGAWSQGLGTGFEAAGVQWHGARQSPWMFLDQTCL